MTEHKGYEASPKKLKQARKEGRALKSQLLTQATAVLALLFSLFSGLAYVWIKTPQMLEWCLSVSMERLGSCTIGMGNQVLMVVFSSLAVAAFAAFCAEVLQVRVEFHWETICPRMNRIDLAAGFQRLFRGLGSSWLLFLKLFLVLILAKYLVLSMLHSVQVAFFGSSLNQISFLLPQVVRIAYQSSALLLFFGGIEYLANRRRFMKEQSMSLDEVRRELKEEEGDPHVKAERKALHEALLIQEIVKRVRSSRVIIVD